MPIRLSGLSSGLDTDSIISELVKAKSAKKETLVKDQKKLSWKQDAWKALNTKIYNLYSKTLDNTRLAGSYSKKSASVSNTNAVSVIVGGGAVNSVQSLKIKQLAQTGYLTGAKLESAGAAYTSETKLTDMGLKAGSSFTLTADGVSTEITVDESMTVGSLVSQLQKAGVNASFDEKNQRFFISSKKTGLDSDFSLTASNSDGDAALKSLGLKTAVKTDAGANKLYQTLASYVKYAADGGVDREATKEALKSYSLVTGTAYSQAQSYSASVTSLNKQLETQNKKMDDLKAKLDDAILTEDDKKAVQKEIDTLQAEIDKNTARRDTESTYYATDKDGKITATDTLVDKVASDMVDKAVYATTVDLNSTDASMATRIYGQNSAISLNGAEFTSADNTYEINGLTITAKQVTGDDAVTITTDNDTNGIYDMVKNFLKEYNTLINEMDKLYNADSSSKYAMLSNDDKESMSEDDIKEWETKIKDSLLRKDSTLSTVSGAMKQIMLEGVKMSNGSTLYMSEFGIGTLGYFSASDNEKNAYHIDGDPDDTNTSAQTDKLKSAIANDPDKVIEFFSTLSKSLYSKLDTLMARTDYSSAYTVYNDKQMKSEYSDYTTKISQQESLINDYEDRYYKKFTAMETAMAKLNSQQSALTSLFGGS